MRNKLELRNNAAVFMSELLLQGSNNKFCSDRFCLQCPTSFPNTYVKEFHLAPTPFKDPQNTTIPVAIFEVIFKGQEIAQKFATEEVILQADIDEVYEGNKSSENAIIHNRVIYKFQLFVKEISYYSLNILLTQPGDISKNFSSHHISCLDTRKDAKAPYAIRFFNFDYFNQIGFQTGITEKPNGINNVIYFMPDIEICLENKTLKIDNLSTYLTDDYHPSDILKIHLFTHQPQQTLNPPPVKTERFFLHGHNIKFDKWQLQGAHIETILFSSSIAFLTQNRNNTDIQTILSSVVLKFDEQKLEDLLSQDIKERLTFLRLKQNENSDSDFQKLNPKIIQEHINVYEYLLNDPSHAHQRDEIHRYIAYFRSRLSWPKSLIFWLTGDYLKIFTPLFCALGLYAVHILFQHFSAFEDTFPFYQIFNFSHLQNKGLCKIISITITNIIRWIVEAAIGYCAFAAGVAIKKRFGMGNAKDFFSSHS